MTFNFTTFMLGFMKIDSLTQQLLSERVKKHINIFKIGHCAVNLRSLTKKGEVA